MENKDQALLFDRLQENYNVFTTEWAALAPEELMEKAEEIYAVQMTKKHLMAFARSIAVIRHLAKYRSVLPA